MTIIRTFVIFLQCMSVPLICMFLNSNRKYIFPAGIGLLAGFFTLVLMAVDPNLFIRRTSFETLRIPYWDGCSVYYSVPGALLDLKYKAIFLRACYLLVDEWFQYLLLPACLTIFFRKLYDIGRKDESIRILVRSIVIACASVTTVSFIWGMASAHSNSGVPPYLQAYVLNGIGCSIFLIWISWLTLIAPAFWILVYLTLVVSSKRNVLLSCLRDFIARFKLHHET